MLSSELIGPALTWAVAKCEGIEVHNASNLYVYTHCDEEGSQYAYEPSKRWEQGGPIIERERLIIEPWGVSQWAASVGRMNLSYGPTPLIAAMRCYVASKLGDEVDIPNELKG